AAVAVGSPWGNAFGVGLTTPGRDSLPKMGLDGPFISAVSRDYFATLGISLRGGRLFTSADRAGSAPVVIVGEAMAKAVWPGENPLGKCLIIGDRRPNAAPLPCSTVVGVV